MKTCMLTRTSASRFIGAIQSLIRFTILLSSWDNFLTINLCQLYCTEGGSKCLECITVVMFLLVVILFYAEAEAPGRSPITAMAFCLGDL